MPKEKQPQTLKDLINMPFSYFYDQDKILLNSIFTDQITKKQYILCRLDTSENSYNLYWVNLKNHEIEYFTKDINDNKTRMQDAASDLINDWNNYHQEIRQTNVLDGLVFDLSQLNKQLATINQNIDIGNATIDYGITPNE